MLKKGFILFIIFSLILMPMCWQNVSYADEHNEDIPVYFNLEDYINLEVKNQYQTDTCVNNATASTIESFIKISRHNGDLQDVYDDNESYSRLAVSRIQTSKINIIPLSETEKIISEYYNGVISTEDELYANKMDESEGLLSEIRKISTQYELVDKNGNKGYLQNLTSIYKEKNEGNIIYRNGYNEVLTADEVNAIRATYKKHIMQNGGIRTSIHTDYLKRDLSMLDFTFYQCCNSSTNGVGNHEVVIIGWDDNFPKENFHSSIRPSSDGAYIALNSWGSEWGDNGIFYISYEDSAAEEWMSGVYNIKPSVDTEEPKLLTCKKNGNVYNIEVSDMFGSGIKETKYVWRDYNFAPDINDSSWVSASDLYSFNVDSVEGKYLWMYSVDNAGNVFMDCLNNAYDIIVRTMDNEIFISPTAWDYSLKNVILYNEDLSQDGLDELITIRTDTVTGSAKINKVGSYVFYVGAVIEKAGVEYETKLQRVEINVTDVSDENDVTQKNVLIEKYVDENGLLHNYLKNLDEFDVERIYVEYFYYHGDDMFEDVVLDVKDVKKFDFIAKRNGVYVINVEEKNGGTFSDIRIINELSDGMPVDASDIIIDCCQYEGDEDDDNESDDHDDFVDEKNDDDDLGGNDDASQDDDTKKNYEENDNEIYYKDSQSIKTGDNIYCIIFAAIVSVGMMSAVYISKKK